MHIANQSHIRPEKRLSILIICLISIYSSLFASSDSLRFLNNIRLGAEVHHGFIYPHHSSIAYSLNSRISGFELNITTDTYGRGSWDKLYRFPRMGAGYFYTNLGNDEVFGKAHALFLFMDIPFSSTPKRIASSYRISYGLAYLTKQFDVTENPLNMAISSGFNMYVNFRYTARLKINERNEIEAGFGFTHFSNGKLATPNLGLNCVAFNLGYLINIIPTGYSGIAETPDLKKHNFEVFLSGGSKTDDQLSGKYYLISSLVLDYKYVPWIKYSFGAGLDFFYDESLGPNKVGDEGGTYKKGDLYQLGFHAGFYPRYSKLTIVLQLGTYVHANYYKYTRVYSRLGFRYEVYNDILINLTLKSHQAIADYLEWGIGYRF